MSHHSAENGPAKDGLPSNSTSVRFDAQEYIGISEDDMVDYDTAEEFLLHFSRAGKLSFVAKLLNLRDAKEIPLNINCKGKPFVRSCPTSILFLTDFSL